MKYALFILFDNDKSLAKQFTGNTSFGTHAISAMQSSASDLVGFEIGDTYADKLKNEKSVALTSNVTEMTFSTFIDKKNKFSINVNNANQAFNGSAEDIVSKTLKHVLTVKGNLSSPDTLFGMGKGVAKKKDNSRIWEWANTPLSLANSNDNTQKAKYYRDVVATVFDMEDKQFRAIILKDAIVDKYEENFDKNGEGHFTLVIAKVITNDAPDENNYDISAKGPDYSQSFTSVMGDVSKAASTVGKRTEDVANIADEVLGKDNAFSKGAHSVSKNLDKLSEDVQKTLGDGSAWTAGNLSKEISDHVSQVEKWKHRSDKTTTDTQTETLDDGSTKTTVTVTNPDGSKDITITTKSSDGQTTSVEKQHKEAPGLI